MYSTQFQLDRTTQSNNFQTWSCRPAVVSLQWHVALEGLSLQTLSHSLSRQTHMSTSSLNDLCSWPPTISVGCSTYSTHTLGMFASSRSCVRFMTISTLSVVKVALACAEMICQCIRVSSKLLLMFILGQAPAHHWRSHQVQVFELAAFEPEKRLLGKNYDVFIGTKITKVLKLKCIKPPLTKSSNIWISKIHLPFPNSCFPAWESLVVAAFIVNHKKVFRKKYQPNN